MVTTETEAPAKPRRVTWLDLLPRENVDLFLARDELIEDLTRQGVDVDTGALVWWEKAGILPRPIRRWRDGAPRALYPVVAIDAIKTLRALQGQGRTLEQIRPLMLAWTLSHVQWQDPVAEPLTRLRAALIDIARLMDRRTAEVRVHLLDEDGEELWRHEAPILTEWMVTPESTTE